MAKTITAVIPAYNEEVRIAATLQAIKKSGFAHEVIVIDDGSRDRTAEIARAEGVKVIELRPNRGKGEALNRAAPHVNGDIVVFLDADLGESAAQGELLVGPIITGQADLTVARFPRPRKKGGFGMVKKLAAWGIRRAGAEVKAPLSGQRAMKREVLLALLPFHSGFGIEVGMSIRALRKGYRLMEVDTSMSHAETGRDLKGFCHRGKQFLHVLRVIVIEMKGGGR